MTEATAKLGSLGLLPAGRLRWCSTLPTEIDFSGLTETVRKERAIRRSQLWVPVRVSVKLLRLSCARLAAPARPPISPLDAERRDGVECLLSGLVSPSDRRLHPHVPLHVEVPSCHWQYPTASTPWFAYRRPR